MDGVAEDESVWWEEEDARVVLDVESPWFWASRGVPGSSCGVATPLSPGRFVLKLARPESDSMAASVAAGKESRLGSTADG